MMDFYYSFIMPNMSSLARGRKNIVMEEIERDFMGYVSKQWEHLCREAVSRNLLFSHRWGEAGRWWGTVPCEEKGSFREMEFDVSKISPIYYDSSEKFSKFASNSILKIWNVT